MMRGSGPIYRKRNACCRHDSETPEISERYEVFVRTVVTCAVSDLSLAKSNIPTWNI